MIPTACLSRMIHFEDAEDRYCQLVRLMSHLFSCFCSSCPFRYLLLSYLVNEALAVRCEVRPAMGGLADSGGCHPPPCLFVPFLLSRPSRDHRSSTGQEMLEGINIADRLASGESQTKNWGATRQ